MATTALLGCLLLLSPCQPKLGDESSMSPAQPPVARCVGEDRRFAAASIVVPEDAKSPKPLISPDGSGSITFHFRDMDDSGTAFYSVQVEIGRKRAKRAMSRPLEIVWSPDSKAVAISQDKMLGNEYLTVFAFREGRMRVFELTDRARKLLGKVRCVAFEAVDVGAVKWTDDSHVLLGVHIRPDAWCENCDLFKLAEFSVDTAKFTAVFDQIEARRRFNDDLGCALKKASDNCALNPGSCFADFKKPRVEGEKGCCPSCRPYSLNPRANPATTVDCSDKQPARPK